MFQFSTKKLQNTELTYELSRIGSSGFRRIKLKQKKKEIFGNKSKTRNTASFQLIFNLSLAGETNIQFTIYNEESLYFVHFDFRRNLVARQSG